MEKIPLNRLNAQKIYRNVVKGDMTLRQLAEGYECSFEQFITECRRLVGDLEWSRVEKADKKNQKNSKNRRDENDNMKTAKYPQRSNAQKKSVVQHEMETVEEQLKVSQTIFEDFQERAEKAKKDEAVALKLYQEAKERNEWTQENLQSAAERVRRYEERLEQLQKMMDEFVTYLVAPGYNGEIPRGKLVVVFPIEGHNVTVEKGDGLLNDVSFAEMFELGFESLKEANTALEFAKLVIKYQVESQEEFKILVDDERIITILRRQEVEI